MKQHEQALLYLKKASEDEALLDAVLLTQSVADSIIGFHCQQAVEKLLKALLSYSGVRFQKTHDLQELMMLLENAGHPLPKNLCQLDELNPYAVEFRYDLLTEEIPFNRTMARDLIREVREYVRNKISSP